MRKFARLTASVLAAVSLITSAPAAAQAQPVAAPYAAGAIGDTFECGGLLGRLWC